ncbi:hypothetical protein D4R75_07885 [bacterium]|nr:MAG: hypothetical protein D4R75_07885 [bacterium]
MTRRPRWLEREQKLALFYSLIVTGALAVYLQQLKEDGDAEGSFGTLVEYQEFSVPSTLRRRYPATDRLRGKEKAQRVEGYSTFRVSVDSARFAQTDKALPPDAPSARNPFLRDSTVAQQSSVFRDYKSDTVLDSIFKSDSTTRQGLLRQHLQHSSSIYDTVSTFQLVRLSQMIRRFDDQPVTLEESTQRNLRRYGHPYNPVRPRPPTAQVPIEGILFRLLDYIF